MRIPVLHVITKLELGGAQLHALEVLRQMDRQRYAPLLYTSSRGLLLSEALRIPGVTVIASPYLDRPLHPLKDILACIDLVRCIRRHGVRIVHTHSSKAGVLGRLAARIAGVTRVVHTVHGWSFNDYQPAPVRGSVIWLERLLARVTARLVTVCEYDRQKGLALGIGTPAQYALVRYGIFPPERTISRDEAKQSLGIPPGEPVVGMVSCLKPQKAPWIFLAAAREVLKTYPAVTFVVAGDGTLRSRLEQESAQGALAGRVKWLGWRRDIGRVRAAFDIFVLSSRWEGLPIALLESMAEGVPAVVTDTGGVREVIASPEAGYVVARDDVAALAAGICRLLADFRLRQGMGEKAAAAVNREYSFEAMMDSLHGVYEACGRERMDA